MQEAFLPKISLFFRAICVVFSWTSPVQIMAKLLLSLHPIAKTPEGFIVPSLSPHPVGDAIEADILADLFPTYLSERSRSVNQTTLTNYKIQTQPFFDWWHEHGPRQSFVLTKALLHQFADWLQHDFRTRSGAKASRNTVRTCLTRLRAFFRWLHVSGRSPLDMSEWLPIPAQPRPTPHILNSDEIHRLFAACEGSLRVRNMALIAFLLETGARRKEAAAITWENVSFHTDFSGYCRLEVVKGYLDFDKRRTVVFGTKCGKLLQLLRITHGHDSGSVFGLTGSGIGQIMTALGNSAGVEFAAHDFRRTFATYWLKHCAATSPSLAERLLDVQLGHSPQTVAQRHYIALTHEDVAAHYVSPLDGVQLFGL